MHDSQKIIIVSLGSSITDKGVAVLDEYLKDRQNPAQPCPIGQFNDSSLLNPCSDLIISLGCLEIVLHYILSCAHSL